MCITGGGGAMFHWPKTASLEKGVKQGFFFFQKYRCDVKQTIQLTSKTRIISICLTIWNRALLIYSTVLKLVPNYGMRILSLVVFMVCFVLWYALTETLPLITYIQLCTLPLNITYHVKIYLCNTLYIYL